MQEYFRAEHQRDKQSNIPIEDVLHPQTIEREHTQNEIVTDTFHFFQDLLRAKGFTEFTAVDEAYRTLPNENIIVRREDPRNILELFSQTESYAIDFEKQRYSNCVEWNPRSGSPQGIRNAYLEGFTNLNSIVTVIGFEKDETDDLQALEDASANFYGLERSSVRSFKGSVTKQKVRFINLRAPGHLLPESDLTDDELEHVDTYLEAIASGQKAQPVMIHRSYIYTSETENEMKKAA